MRTPHNRDNFVYCKYITGISVDPRISRTVLFEIYYYLSDVCYYLGSDVSTGASHANSL